MSNADPVYAYCGQRAIDRKSTKGVTRHAVTTWSLLSGAMDAECGAIGMVRIGDWEPDTWDTQDEPACATCAKYLAGEVVVPEQVAEDAARAAAEEAARQRAAEREARRLAAAEERRQRKLVAADRCGTVSIFDAA